MEVGIDLVEINRIRQLLERHPNFPQRILSPDELKQYQTFNHNKRRLTYLAGRFAVKEAYSKAMGEGLGGGNALRQISVLNDGKGRPYLDQGPIQKGVSLSISHEDYYAVAIVVIP